MDKKTFETGLQIRSEVLGKGCRKLDEFADDFTSVRTSSPILLGRGLGSGSHEKYRSILNLAMIAILNRPTVETARPRRLPTGSQGTDPQIFIPCRSMRAFRPGHAFRQAPKCLPSRKRRETAPCPTTSTKLRHQIATTTAARPRTYIGGDPHDVNDRSISSVGDVGRAAPSWSIPDRCREAKKRNRAFFSQSRRA